MRLTCFGRRARVWFCETLLVGVAILGVTVSAGAQTRSAPSGYAALRDSARRVDSLAALAELQGDTASRRRALGFWRQSAARWATLADSTELARSLTRLGRVHRDMGHPDSALAYFRQALSITRAAGDTVGEAAALTSIGVIFRTSGRPDSALAYHRQALSLYRAAGDRGGEAAALTGVGVAFKATGRPDSALAYYRQALPLTRAAGNQGLEATALNNIGAVFGNAGRLDSALAYYRAALPLDRAAGNHGSEAVTLRNIGDVFGETDSPDSALTYYQQALAIKRAVRIPGRQTFMLSHTGSAFDKTGRPDSAFARYRAALSIARVSGDRAGEAMTLHDIGAAYSGTGRSDSALAHYRQALSIEKEVDDWRGEAATLNNIGAAFAKSGRFNTAVAYYRQALPLRRAMGDRRGEANTLGNIGVVFARTDRPDSALAYLRQALTLERDIGDRGGEASTLIDAGTVLSRTAHYDSAFAYFRRALTLARAARMQRSEAAALNNIGVAFARTGHPDLALVFFDTAAVLKSRIRQHAGSDANAIAVAEQARGTVDAWVAAWLAIAQRARNSNAPSPDIEARAIVGALGAAERGRAQGLRDLLMAARDYGTVDSPAVAAAPVSGLVASDIRPGGDLPAEAAAALAPLRARQVAALYYFVGRDTLTTWLLTPVGALTLAGQTAVRRDSLAALVATLRAGLGNVVRAKTVRATRGDVATREATTAGSARGVSVEGDTARASAALAALAQVLFPRALAEAVPAGTEVLVVPHGVLGFVPFAALPTPLTTGDPLTSTVPFGVRYALRYAPSLRAADAAEARPTDWDVRGAGPAASSSAGASGHGTILVVGNPAMPWVNDVVGARVRLEALPGARAEALTVAARFRAAGTPVQLLLDTAATETAVRAALPAARVVHLATHGFAYGTEARVRDSYIALAPDSAHSGLFTISTLLDEVPPLRADLVVLSACQTGLGQLADAEGTVGFQRALLARGARSVLVSLWSVDDAATGALLTRFYAHWLGPDGRPARSKAVALQQAEADVRSDPQHPAWKAPRYWAAFQLVGAP